MDNKGRQETKLILKAAVNSEKTGFPFAAQGVNLDRFTSGRKPEQVLETHTYDLFGRETSSSTPNSLGGQVTTSTEYDARSRVAATVSAEGVRTEIRYDAADRPVRTTEAPGTAFERVTEMVYDGRGDLVEERFPDVGQTFVTRYAYDVLGRRTSVSGDRAAAVSLTYDSSDRVLTSTDGRGNETVLTYNALGRLKTRTLPAVSGSPAAVTTSYYDAVGNIKKRGQSRMALS